MEVVMNMLRIRTWYASLTKIETHVVHLTTGLAVVGFVEIVGHVLGS
jgi:hypothetical protein